MSKFKEYLLNNVFSGSGGKGAAFLIQDDDKEKDVKSKDDYITNAETGLVVAFRLHFKAKSGINLSKVISGMILENNKESEMYIVETKNNLKYGVPYSSVVWVKTGGRWPKGVYEEMKKGPVVVSETDNKVEELEELEQFDGFDKN